MPLVFRSALDRELAELLVPGCTQSTPHLVEVPVRDFLLKIFARLLDAEEGCAHARLDEFSLRVLKFRVGTGCTVRLRTVGIRSGVLESLTKLDYEIAFEMRQRQRT